MKSNISVRTKLNIFFLAIKVALCFSLLIYGTYALFTDREQNNVIVTAANMKMELFSVDAYGNETNIAGDGNNIFGTELWEPGQTRIVFLKVGSQSEIDAKYTLNLIVHSGDLDGAIEYCAFAGGPVDVIGDTWESISDSKDVRLLLHGQNPLLGSTHVEISPGEEHYYTLFIHMREDASNFQDKTTRMDIHLYATQGNADT